MEKVSVIVPIYNVEKYLRQCIESILNQTFQAIEVILVDDGSPDNCGVICDEYASNDNRIVVIHKKNGGLSAARNAGIRKATSDWILFVDSDDWLDDDYLEKLYGESLKEDSISICGCVQEYKQGLWRKRGTSGTKIISEPIELQVVNANALPIFFNPLKNGVKFDVIPSPWNKLYNRKILIENKLFFKENIRVGEDAFFNLEYLAYVKEVKIVDSYGYHYRLTDTGITKKFDSNRLKKDEELFRQIDEYVYKSDNPYLPDYANANICITFILNLKRYYFSPLNPRNIDEKKEELLKTMGEKRYQKAFEEVKEEMLGPFQKYAIRAARKKNVQLLYLLFLLNEKRKG